MNNKLPLVTVITTVYNRADLVDETILSVLNQDYPNIEYIVLDDGSTDNSWQVLQKYKDRVILGRHENMGESRTVNKGFSMAKGEIIGVLSSDDLLFPGAVSTMVKYLTDHPQIIVVYPDYQTIDQNGKVTGQINTVNYGYSEMLSYFNCLPGVGAFFSASIVKKLNGRDPCFRFVADFDFWLRAGLLGDFMRVPQILGAFRVHPASTTVSNKGNMMAQEHLDLAKKILSLPDFPKEFQKLRNQAMSSAYFVAWYVSGRSILSRNWRYLLRSAYYSPAKITRIVVHYIWQRFKKIIGKLKSFRR